MRLQGRDHIVKRISKEIEQIEGVKVEIEKVEKRLKLRNRRVIRVGRKSNQRNPDQDPDQSDVFNQQKKPRTPPFKPPNLS